MNQDYTFVTFSCDRPGVGQSMALASSALILAANGRRVLVIDWDFSKPSLYKYFIPFLNTNALEINDGVIDILWDYSSVARRTSQTAIPELQHQFASIKPIECTIPDELRMSKGGGIDFLPAGREPRRSLRTRYFSWGEFFDKLDGEGLLTLLWTEMKKRYDHILIDCPQLSNITKYPVLNADILVPCFTLDSESMEQAVRLAHWATDRLTVKQLAVCPLTMRVATAELNLLMRAREKRERMFQDLEKVIHHPRSVFQLHDVVEVPETLFYINQRLLPPLFSHQGPVAAYRQLAVAFSNKQDIEWKIPEEEQDNKYRLAYEVIPDKLVDLMQPLFPPYSGDESYAFVSYAYDDRDEVMPILQEFLDFGWRVWWDEEIPGGTEWQSYLRNRIANATCVVVFLSSQSGRSKWVAEEIRLAQEFSKPFLNIRLDWKEFPEELLQILSRYQILNRMADNFHEQLGRGIQLLDNSKEE